MPAERPKRKGVKIHPKMMQRRASDYCDYRQELFKKFQIMGKNQAFVRAKNNFLKLLGRHTPINYSPEFNFKQQWEMTNIQEKQPQFITSNISTAISLLRLVLMCISLWGISTNLFFEIEDYEWIYIILIVQSLIQLAKFIIMFERYDISQKTIRMGQIVINIFYGAFFLIAGVREVKSAWSRILGIFIVVQIYMKLSTIYQSIKYYNITSQYRDMVNLFELSMLLIAITHIFALLLSGIVDLNPYQNWMIKMGVSSKSWSEKYIYSLYFSSTTLLTVGYGDIYPTNIHEILAILLTQFFGIATFGYTVNQIGLALSNMQQRNERLQKDLSTVENYGKSSRLDPDSICKMRTEVINNKRLDEDLCLQQENQLLEKFSEDLRQKIKFESNMKVIKRSVFMIVNWSGRLQNRIANKLIKQVYKAEQLLLQQHGKQKLYILEKGKIDIIYTLKGTQHINLQKVLKSLCSNENRDLVTSNVYGYSSLMSQRKINLCATAKETCICYTLFKSDFLELLAECDEDRQHYHQLRCLINQSNLPEALEVPSIVNIREHYQPSALYLAHREKQSQDNMNFRKNVKVRNTARRKMIFTNAAVSTHNYTQQKGNDRMLKSCKGEFENDKFTQGDLSIQSAYTALDQNYEFQACKSYERYFKKGNVENIIKKLNTINYNRKKRRSIISNQF